LEELQLQSLLKEIAAGSQTAFAALYDATSARVYGLAQRIVRCEVDAEEVVGDVFLQAWRQADRYDPTRGTPLAWLLALARSRALDRLRRRDPAQLSADPHAAARERGDDGLGPESLLLAVERGTAVHAALARLRPIQQDLLDLAFWRGLTHQEIAAEVGMPLGTVKSHIRKALQVLAEALCADGHGGPRS
jgi:RNA polymerase sigma-70 factor (ECF subfamily)